MLHFCDHIRAMVRPRWYYTFPRLDKPLKLSTGSKGHVPCPWIVHCQDRVRFEQFPDNVFPSFTSRSDKALKLNLSDRHNHGVSNVLDINIFPPSRRTSENFLLAPKQIRRTWRKSSDIHWNLQGTDKESFNKCGQYYPLGTGTNIFEL